MKFVNCLLIALASSVAFTWAAPLTQEEILKLTPEELSKLSPEEQSEILKNTDFKDKVDEILKSQNTTTPSTSSTSLTSTTTAITSTSIPSTIPEKTIICDGFEELLMKCYPSGEIPDINSTSDCNRFYDNSNCKELVEYANNNANEGCINPAFVALKLTLNLFCARAENNSYCPMSKIYDLMAEKNYSPEKVMGFYQETCISKQCVENAKKALPLTEDFRVFFGIDVKQNEIENVLNTCKPEDIKITTDTPKASGAKSVVGKIGITTTALLASALALLF